MLAQTSAISKGERTSPLVKRFLDHLFLECGLAGLTITAYQRDLNEFWDFLVDADVEPSEISMDDVRRHLIELQGRGLALSSIVRHLASVKVFLRFLFAERILRRDVASLIESPRRWRTVPQAARYDQIKSLLQAPDQRDELYLRDRAILEFLYATGMRVTEATKLDVDNINLKLGYARCLGKGSRERIVPLGGCAIDAVNRYVTILRPRLVGDRETMALFLSRTGRRLDRTNTWRLVKKHAARAGIETPFSPHTIRHCFATHLMAGGADLRVVQELLGHASITTTQVYTHVDETQLRHVHRKYHPRP